MHCDPISSTKSIKVVENDFTNIYITNTMKSNYPVMNYQNIHVVETRRLKQEDIFIFASDDNQK